MATIELFQRRWSLTVGPDGGEGRKWTDLKTTFKVEKTGSSTPNKVEVAIYNLSPDSRGFVEKKGNVLILEAGYKAEIKLLGTGDVRLVTHAKEGPDWVTKFECDDGGKAHRTIVHESFGKDTSEADVVNHLAKKLGVKLGKLQGLSDAKFGKGRQLTGPARAQLDALCKSRGLRWSIQDGVLQILPAGSDTGADAILLNDAHGLVGSPEKTEAGIKVTSLLRGGINPGQLVKVESRQVTGFFVAEKVTHEGDSSGGSWYTQVEALRAG